MPTQLQTFFARWWKLILTILLLGLSIVFVWQEGPQLAQAIRYLPLIPLWVAGLAIGVTILYVVCCGLMYVGGFRATGANVPLKEAVQLWLRRNFLSVFLPAGGLSSLAFYNRSLRESTAQRPALTNEQIVGGTLVYFVTGYGSLLLVSFPVLALGMGVGLLGNAGWSIVVFVSLLLGAYGSWQSFRKKGWVYRKGQRYVPHLLTKLEPLPNQSLARLPLLLALVASVGVELCGVAHVTLAIVAVGQPVTWTLVLTTYVVATLFFALSPVLRGLGAVETSMTLVLTQLGGIPLPLALTATLFYRLFEFWLPLLLGVLSFIWQRGNLILRVIPSFLVLMLGVVNLLSAITPGLTARMRILESLLPTHLQEVSNYIVMGSGLLLVLLSIGLLRGYWSAWTLTVGLVSLSMVMHLTKAFDFEEALFAGAVLLVLLYTQPQYRLAAPPLKRLARVLNRRVIHHRSLVTTTDEMRETAGQLVRQFGHSSLDYFKLYNDKEIFLLAQQQAFVAYRVWGRYIVVLESPVCPPELLAESFQAFDKVCYKRGYQPLYYRVDQDDVAQLQTSRKRSLMIGQEGLVNLLTFSLEGRDRKSLRNSLKRAQTSGYSTKICQPPLRDSLLQQLQAVSFEWLETEGISEKGFSQGVFNIPEIKHQPVVVVENAEGKIMAFANIIPDYAPDEGTYDLIRKTDDAPNGVSDVLLMALIQYGQKQGWKTLNLGLAPLSGIDEVHDVAEQAIKLAYERISVFSHLKGLRAFKDKYADEWRDKYLLYNEDLDLMQASIAIQRVARYDE